MLFGAVLLFSSLFTLPDGKLHIVFCNVGQGDAAYIRAPNNQDMLIDGGPDDKVLTCLGRHMPFYDRTIDVVILSHPQKDHLQGLISVLQRYSVKYFVIGIEGNETEGYKKLANLIREKNIPVKNLYTGDQFSLGKVRFSILWPERKWVSAHVASPLSDLSYLGPLGGSGNPAVLGLSTTSELNDFSYILNLNYGSLDVLFPGDGDTHIQPEVLEVADLPDIDILKVPHHGSKTGMLPEFLDKIKPELAIISVGKNSYGHPTKEAIELLSNRAVKIKRTDREGEIEIVSDGTKY
jgi:competence protein ComEC